MFAVVEKQRSVGRVKELELELSETQQKMAGLMKQNADQLTAQVVHPAAFLGLFCQHCCYSEHILTSGK